MAAITPSTSCRSNAAEKRATAASVAAVWSWTVVMTSAQQSPAGEFVAWRQQRSEGPPNTRRGTELACKLLGQRQAGCHELRIEARVLGCRLGDTQP